ncbi:acyl-CoA carboxylase subunit epsilon [Streptomyces cocklensis]|uniref:Acyl-CoA carboxylase epsilon subunit n=1 Tax=Actinacidiphila cocklensis TaxID=887465 RepID=A0A9W4GN49_9ACTN|nr:acyl-CoA carboxylase subunit epsilon [Actinacidiphila cocklensis]MDD1058705.1 acyl-CoA carboxylase subunit epsilon [Actinacidiphila cocklensis]WSX75092.1 acyl-CoA carboxylase subunit epsilon [Streptomyces sp. NBC_00899]CAG6390895.1 Acyl-CoA carboxylase epsilon subunit [Actinacidiphila cocklensis]
MDLPATDTTGLLRVRHGQARPEDVAALMAVLHARAAALGGDPGDPADSVRPLAEWHRPERHAPYTDPRSWHAPPTPATRP